MMKGRDGRERIYDLVYRAFGFRQDHPVQDAGVGTSSKGDSAGLNCSMAMWSEPIFQRVWDSAKRIAIPISKGSVSFANSSPETGWLRLLQPSLLTGKSVTYNRKEIGDFVEVYCKCSLEVCIRRDVKGLYKKALAGEIRNYTGVDDPYEEPLDPEVVLETDRETPEESVQKIIQKLENLGYLPRIEESVYTAEEEEKVKKRLEDLGYL